MGVCYVCPKSTLSQEMHSLADGIFPENANYYYCGVLSEVHEKKRKERYSPLTYPVLQNRSHKPSSHIDLYSLSVVASTAVPA